MRKTRTFSRLVLLTAAFYTLTSVSVSGREQVSFVVPDSSSLDIYSARYTQTDDGREAENLLADLSGFELKLENARLAVYYRAETQGIRILNKNTGYVWGGLSSDKPSNMNDQWSQMGNALITIDYFDADIKSNRLSLGAKGTSAAIDWGTDQAVGTASFESAGIAFEFTLTLDEDALTVSVNRESLRETGTGRLESIWLLPFLGASEQDTTPGYMFVPDGSGALIRYEKSAQYVSAYNERVYGKDPGVDEMSVAGDLLAKRNNDYLTDMSQITVPVYGAVHGVGQNAYLAVITGGAEYASVYASPAGLITAYHWVSARFDYRNSYNTPLNKSGKGVISTQDAVEPVDATVSFYFLSGESADYSGMAVRYRELLEQQDALPGGERVDADVPLYLTLMAADVKKSLLGTQYVSLTTVSEMADILASLDADGITNLTVDYSGWQKGGLNGASFGQTKLDSRLGSRGELEAVRASLTDGGGRFYLAANAIGFNKDQARAASASALKISKEYAAKTRSNTALMYPTSYFARPSLVVGFLEKLTEKYAGWGLSLNGVGNTAYGDYTRGKSSGRGETAAAFTQAVAAVGKTGVLLLSNPNRYLWTYTGEYTNMPLQNSQYLFETDSVPFLPMVLKGSVDYYATYANQSSYTQSGILKMIEYGAYPSFVVMAASNEKLIDTPLADYFSLNYDDWSPVIEEVYASVDDALKAVEGSRINKHTVLADGVAAVAYDNGTTIYVNYTENAYTAADGTVVPAGDYLVKEAG